MNNCYSHLQTFNNICPCSLHAEYQLMPRPKPWSDAENQRWVQWFSDKLKSDTCCFLSFTSTTHSSGLAAFFSIGTQGQQTTRRLRSWPAAENGDLLKTLGVKKEQLTNMQGLEMIDGSVFIFATFVYTHVYIVFSLNFLETEEFWQRWVCTI